MIKQCTLIVGILLLQINTLDAAAYSDVSIKKKVLYKASEKKRIKALFVAIEREDGGTFQYLIKEYPELAKVYDKEGNIPLLKILENKNYRKGFWKEALPILIAAGVNMNSSDLLQRWTPLLRAASNENVPLELIETLVEHGARIDDIKEQETALMYAAGHGRVDITKYLIQQHADPRPKDRFGKTASDWARMKDYESLAEHIELYESEYKHAYHCADYNCASYT